jgi:hypothetical protein
MPRLPAIPEYPFFEFPPRYVQYLADREAEADSVSIPESEGTESNN